MRLRSSRLLPILARSDSKAESGLTPALPALDTVVWVRKCLGSAGAGEMQPAGARAWRVAGKAAFTLRQLYFRSEALAATVRPQEMLPRPLRGLTSVEARCWPCLPRLPQRGSLTGTKKMCTEQRALCVRVRGIVNSRCLLHS